MTGRGMAIQGEVLATLRGHNGALSAYGLLEVLKRRNPKIAPPTIYRALSALSERGEVHRIESLNSFAACRCTQHEHTAILSICDLCGAVEENISPEVLNDVSSTVGASGFSPRRHMIEVHGRCAACMTGDSAR